MADRMTVRTRFAPSPTGLLHIGGARTALFNYLFSRHHGGEFLLRIEDTDRARSTAAFTAAILDSLDWMGLERDEPESTNPPAPPATPRSPMPCWRPATPIAAGPPRRRSPPLARRREPRAARCATTAPGGTARTGPDPYVIRLRAPREGEMVVEDRVQGAVRVANAELDDMIILRSDGTPTYQHAVVVDDHDMGITDVIRGDDHLTNTFSQVQVYLANGWEVPRFAHLPLIHGPDGAKLSKRHGAASVTEFRDAGYLPEALCNYLLRLGWAHGDLEILGRDGGDSAVRPGRGWPRRPAAWTTRSSTT